jgi:hypothetical protein
MNQGGRVVRLIEVRPVSYNRIFGSVIARQIDRWSGNLSEGARR